MREDAYLALRELDSEVELLCRAIRKRAAESLRRRQRLENAPAVIFRERVIVYWRRFRLPVALTTATVVILIFWAIISALVT